MSDLKSIISRSGLLDHHTLAMMKIWGMDLESPSSADVVMKTRAGLSKFLEDVATELDRGVTDIPKTVRVED